MLEQFGHTHDQAEAATLLDPETRELLRSALDEMWQSEAHLRQGHPELALPYAYRALGFIKQVQQASRIYLARVGLELPPIDESRRLGGDRAGLGDRADPLTDATAADPCRRRCLARARAGARRRRMRRARSRRARALVAAHDARGADPLALAAAIDALRRDPRLQRLSRTPARAAVAVARASTGGDRRTQAVRRTSATPISMHSGARRAR